MKTTARSTSVLSRSGLPPFARHRANAVLRMADHDALSLRDHFRPRSLVAELRRAGEPGLVAVLADLVVHVFAASRGLRARRCRELDLADRHDATDDVLVRLIRALHSARDPLRDDHRDRDRHGEREHDHNGELLPVLDRGDVLGVFLHGRSWSGSGLQCRRRRDGDVIRESRRPPISKAIRNGVALYRGGT